MEISTFMDSAQKRVWVLKNVPNLLRYHRTVKITNISKNTKKIRGQSLKNRFNQNLFTSLRKMVPVSNS